MENFPSRTAKILAVKRVTKPASLTNETLKEGIEAAVSVAINYDGAKIVQAISINTTGVICSDEFAQKTWDEINGKYKPKTS